MHMVNQVFEFSVTNYQKLIIWKHQALNYG